MSEYASKLTESKTTSVANQVKSKAVYQLVDNGPEAIAQMSLHHLVNNSPSARQLKAYQEMANNSPRVQQLKAYQAMANNYTTQPLQRFTSPSTNAPNAAAPLQKLVLPSQPLQKKANSTGLPNNLKAGIENMAGLSMDDVKVHYNSAKPAQLQAHAYAQGTDIHIAPGQEKHLSHEAWHVVQQKQGRVKPTLQMKGGVKVNDDKGLEREADIMGARAVVESASSKQVTQRAKLPNVIQRFIAIVGEEVPEGSTTLQEGAEKLQEIHSEDQYYTEDDIDSGAFEAPKADETIYLIAHGDNPAVSLTKEAALGDKNGEQVKNIIKKILQKFAKESGGVQFSGRIILEGCHTAEPVVGEDNKSKKGSMLFDVQHAMKEDKFFNDHMAPEATIGGYLGQAFSGGDYSTGYGTANTEHPLTRRFQKQRGMQGQPMEGGKSTSYDNTESFLESRWKKYLDFGAPEASQKGKKKKRK